MFVQEQNVQNLGTPFSLGQATCLEIQGALSLAIPLYFLKSLEVLWSNPISRYFPPLPWNLIV